jgi:hypothetical protein
MVTNPTLVRSSMVDIGDNSDKSAGNSDDNAHIDSRYFRKLRQYKHKSSKSYRSKYYKCQIRSTIAIVTRSSSIIHPNSSCTLQLFGIIPKG